MKKLLLTLGAVASVAAPVAAVVACSSDNKDNFDLGTISGHDLAKNIAKTPSDLNDIATKLAAKIFKDGVKSISFKLDGKNQITFDFGTDVFYHNGNKADDGGKVNTGADTVAEFGVDADYIGTTQTEFAIKDGKLVKSDSVTTNNADFLTATKYVIRMAIAAKTPLHYVSGQAWLEA